MNIVIILDCDLLESEIRDSYKETLLSLCFFRFLRLCFRVLYFLQHRSSHRRCSVKRDAPKNFAYFTGKHLCRSLFLIILQLKLYLKETPAECFPVKFEKFLRTPFLKNNCQTTAFDSTVFLNQRTHDEWYFSNKIYGVCDECFSK